MPGTPSEHFVDRVTQSTEWFDEFKEEEQTWFVRMLLSRMHHHQHGSINSYLKPILQRDFITLLPKKGLDHVAETILSYLDAKSLWWMSYETVAILNKNLAYIPQLLPNKFVDKKKSETCYLCCVACGGYM